MDYEKKYKEAFLRAREINLSNDEMEYLFPELKEEMDKQIRKSLIILLQHFCKGYRVPGLNFPVSYKEMLAWVEKKD
jgi:hypothetical protein